MKLKIKTLIMQLGITLSILFLSMWLISDTRIFIGLMVFGMMMNYENRILKR